MRLVAASLIATAIVATAPAGANAATTGSISADPVGLGTVYVSWNLLGNGGTTSELLQGDRVVDRQVDPYPPGTGAGIGGGHATIVIPDSELYGSEPIVFTLRILDDAGKILAVSPVASVGPCPARPARAQSPTDVRVLATGARSVRVAWTPAFQGLCHAVPTGYAVTVNGVTQTVPAGAPDVPPVVSQGAGLLPSASFAGLSPGTRYDISVTALPAAVVQPEAPAKTSFTTDAGTDTSAPTQPGPLTVTGKTDSLHSTNFIATWGASTDDVGVAAYDLYSGDLLVASVAGTSTTATLMPGYGSNRATPLTVVARDSAGNVSPPTEELTFDSCRIFGPPARPIAPTDPAATAVTSTTATITWSPGPLAYDCEHVTPSSYSVYQENGPDGFPVPLGDTSLTGDRDHLALTGLAPGTEYTVYVVPNGGYGGTRTNSITFTTKAADAPATQSLDFTATGSATIKKLVSGTLPLTGSLHGTLTSATGAFSGDLSFAPSAAKLVAFGFLPVTATIKLAPTAPLTGAFAETSFTGSVPVRVKVPAIRAFGITVGGGANCQTTRVSTIPLSSTGAFTAAAGGTLVGGYTISSLTGCGGLSGLLSPIIAGAGNAIALKLTPVAAG